MGIFTKKKNNMRIIFSTIDEFSDCNFARYFDHSTLNESFFYISNTKIKKVTCGNFFYNNIKTELMSTL